MISRVVFAAVSLASVAIAAPAYAQVATTPVTAPQSSWAASYTVNPFTQIAYGPLVAPAPFLVTTVKEGTGARGFDAEFDASKQKDTHRGISWFYVEAVGGLDQVSLLGTSAYTLGLAGSQTGAVVGGEIGLRALYFTLGFRGQVDVLGTMQMPQLGGEIGLHLPFGVVEPRFALGGGYAAPMHITGSLGSALSVHGGYGHATAGLDVYPHRYVSLGVETSADVMGFSRAAVGTSTLETLRSQGLLSDADVATYGASGSGFAAAFELTASIGLHF